MTVGREEVLTIARPNQTLLETGKRKKWDGWNEFF